MRSAFHLFVVVLALLLSACENAPEEPTFCAYRAAEVPAPEKVTRDECKAKRDTPLRLNDQEGFFVLHLLPDGVVVDEPLTLTFTTPCASTSIERRHVHGAEDLPSPGKVLFAARAPEGAACSLSIAASILNSSEGIVTLPASADSCATVGDSCPDAESDGGAGNGG
jgi:hypothetical protein